MQVMQPTQPLHIACACYRHVMQCSTAVAMLGTFQLDTCAATLQAVVLVTAFAALPL